MNAFLARKRIHRAAPILVDGVRFEELSGARAEGFEQNGGILAAIEEKSQKLLWTLQLWQNDYSSGWETDILDSHISEILLLEDQRTLEIHGDKNQLVYVDMHSHTCCPLCQTNCRIT